MVNKFSARFCFCAVLIIVSLAFAACGSGGGKYQVGQIFQPAANHSSWSKINPQPKLSRAHGKYVTVYANESASQVKLHGGSYRPGDVIVKEAFSDPNNP